MSSEANDYKGQIRARYHPPQNSFPFALRLQLHLHRYRFQEHAERQEVYQLIGRALNKASRLLIGRLLGLVPQPSALSVYDDIEAINDDLN